MTPTDALIEKMARTKALENGWKPVLVNVMFSKPTPHRWRAIADAFTREARAAYEAEHGDVLRDALDGGVGMARVSLNEKGELVTERIAPEAWRAEHEEDGK